METNFHITLLHLLRKHLRGNHIHDNGTFDWIQKLNQNSLHSQQLTRIDHIRHRIQTIRPMDLVHRLQVHHMIQFQFLVELDCRRHRSNMDLAWFFLCNQSYMDHRMDPILPIHQDNCILVHSMFCIPQVHLDSHSLLEWVLEVLVGRCILWNNVYVIKCSTFK